MINISTSIDSENSLFILEIGGEVDASSSIHLDTALQEALKNNKKILVDLSSLDYISSAGLGVFMSVLQDIENQKIGFVIFGMKEKVYEVFDILGLTQLLKITNTKEEAIAEVK